MDWYLSSPGFRFTEDSSIHSIDTWYLYYSEDVFFVIYGSGERLPSRITSDISLRVGKLQMRTELLASRTCEFPSETEKQIAIICRVYV